MRELLFQISLFRTSNTLPQIFQVLAFTVMLCLLAAMDGSAGHRAGGQYYWECLNDSTYVIKWNAYIDCDHNVDPQTSYFIYGPSGGDPNVGTFDVDFSSSTPHQYFDPCTPCAVPWMTEVAYYDTVVFQSPMAPWYGIGFDDGGNRPSGAYTSSGGYFNGGILYTGVCNSTAVPTNFADVIFEIFDTAVMVHNYVDPDGDSLDFSLVDCLEDPATSISYSGGFSGANPMSSSIGWFIDSVGNVTFLPDAVQNGPICLQVDEYRGGVLIASTINELFVSTIAPQAPSMMIAEDSVTVNIAGEDTCDRIDFATGFSPGYEITATVIMDSVLLAHGAVWNALPPGDMNNYGTLCWTPPCDFTGKGPFIVEIRLQDNECPINNRDTVFYSVHVDTPLQPVALFYPYPDTCSDLFNVTMNNTSTKDSSWYWTFENLTSGQVDTSVLRSPNHSFLPGMNRVTLVVQNRCLADTFTHQFEVKPLPFADAGKDSILCLNDTIQLFGLSSGVSSVWVPPAGLSNPNIVNPLFYADTTRTYNWTVTGANGCVSRDPITLTVGGDFNVDAGNDTSVCAGSFAFLGGSPTAPPGMSYSWTNSSDLNFDNIPNPTATSSQDSGWVDYIVTVTDVYGCSIDDTVAVYSKLAPRVDAGVGGFICQGQSIDLLATGANSYLWVGANLSNPNSSNPTATPNITTTYTVFGTDAVGCTNRDEVTIYVFGDDLINIIAVDTTLCPGDTFILDATVRQRFCTDYQADPIAYAPIAGSGDTITLEKDDYSKNHPIGFSFEFYCENYTEFHFSSNGYITFSNENNETNPQVIPDLNDPNGMIAYAWDEWEPNFGLNGEVIQYYTLGSAPNRVLVIDIDSMIHRNDNNTYLSQQIHIHETSNIIEIHTNNQSYGGGDMTMGIENQNGSIGLTVPGRNKVPWTISSTDMDAWRFSPVTSPTFTYDWTPGSGLVDSTLARVKGTYSGPISYTVEVSNGFCTGQEDIIFLEDASLNVTTIPVEIAICDSGVVPLHAFVNYDTVGPKYICDDYTISAIPFDPIEGGGENINLEDNSTSKVEIGFGFEFYCKVYDEVRISSNGFLKFGNPDDGCCSGQTLPDAAPPNNIIAAAWEDLDPDNGADGLINYYTTGSYPNRIFVVNYVEVPHAPGPGPNDNVTAQIQLHEYTNTIEIHLAKQPDSLGFHTTGLENEFGNIAHPIPDKNGSNWSATNVAYRFTLTQLLPAPPPVTYSWTPSTGLTDTTIYNPFATVNGNTIYEVTVYNGACAAIDTAFVYVKPDTSLKVLAQDIVSCPNSEVPLNAEAFYEIVTPDIECDNYVVSPIPFHWTYGPSNPVSLDDEDVEKDIKIGFDFQFFCETYDNVSIGSNGFLTFDSDEEGCCEGQHLPNTADPSALIAFAWNNLDPGLGANGTIEYYVVGSVPNRIFVVNFLDVPHYPGPGPNNDITAQIKLFETSNVIEIHTVRQPDSTGIHTMGIENQDGNIGFWVPGRNADQWSAFNEAWRFEPNNLTPTVTNIFYEWSPSYLISDTSILNPVALVGNTSVDVIFRAVYNACVSYDTVTITVQQDTLVDILLENDTACPGALVHLNPQVTIQRVDSVRNCNEYRVVGTPYGPIPGNGIAVPLENDDVQSGLPIGFDFEFFCNVYDEFTISSNGFIQFGQNNEGCCDGQVVPDPVNPNNLIAFAWENLNPELADGGGGRIEYFMTGSTPHRKLVVNFIDVPHYNSPVSSTDSVTAQVILYETTNIIEIHTTTQPDITGFHTMGIENEDGTAGHAVPDRNSANWTTDLEAWRFEPVYFTAPGEGPFYHWTPSTGISDTVITDPTQVADTSLTYQFIVEYNYCRYRDTVEIVRQQDPSFVVYGQDQYACPGAPVQLNANYDLEVDTSCPTCRVYDVDTVGYAPIAGSGTVVALADDEVSSALPIGFNFDFFCNRYSEFHISSNGFLALPNNRWSEEAGGNGTALPNLGDPQNSIAFAWGNLDPSAYGTISYWVAGTAPNRILVVEYDSVAHQLSGADYVSVQVHLYESSNIIEVHIEEQPEGYFPHTVGIQDITSSIGYAPAGKNGQTWGARNEAYRFSPGYSGPPTPAVYSWLPPSGLTSDSINSPIATLDSSIQYIVTIDYNHCTTTDTITVTRGPDTTVVLTGTPDTTVCFPQTVQLGVEGSFDTLECRDFEYAVNQIAYSPVAGIGTSVLLDDNEISGNLPIGFGFDFFCNTYTNFKISSNGFLAFSGSNDGCCTGQQLPDPSNPDNLIAFAWTDLDPKDGGTIEYFTTGSAPNRILVVNFQNVHYLNLPDPLYEVTSQVLLYESNNVIEIHTAQAGGIAEIQTMGIENSGGSEAYWVPGRNGTHWKAYHDAYRFTPLYDGFPLPAPPSFSWSPSSGLSSTTITNPTADIDETKSYVVTYTYNSCSISDTLTIYLGPDTNLIVTATTDTIICPGAQVQLNAQWVFNGVVDTPVNCNDYTIQGIPFAPIAGAGTEVAGLGNDDIDGPFPVGFDFEFYCNTYDDFYLGSDGYLTFSGGQTPEDAPQSLPDPADVNNIIAFAWADLKPDGGSTLEYFTTGTAPNRILVINIIDLKHDPNPENRVTSQILLYETTNTIEIHTTTQPDLARDHTMGLENIDGTLAHPVPGRNQGNWTAFSEGYRFYPTKIPPAPPVTAYTWTPGSTLSDSTIATPTASPTSTTRYIVEFVRNNCPTHDTVLVTVNDYAIALDSQDVTCFGANDGVAFFDSLGGTPPHTFNWSNGATTDTAWNLAAGIYYVTVTDSFGCTQIDSIQINQPPSMILQTDSTDVSCSGGSNGSATISVSGGTPAYSWTHDGLLTDSQAIVTGLSAGLFSTTITDSAGCSIVANVAINEPGALTIALDSTDVSCFGGSDGTASATPVGGTPAYTYLWSNGDTLSTIDSLAAGFHSITITDANNCVRVDSIWIQQPTQLTIALDSVDVRCNGGSDGRAFATVSGGVGPYSYLWSGGQTGDTASNLSEAIYHVTVTDDSACSITDSIGVIEPDALTFDTIVSDVTCFNYSDGAIDLAVSGAVPPYSYNWSNGATTEDIASLLTGTYSVTVTDSNGCVDSLDLVVVQPALILISGDVTHSSSPGASDGAIDVTVAGGSSPYGYTWNTGAGTEDLSLISNGLYTIVVTDDSGCVATTGFNITSADTFIATAAVINGFCGLNDGSIDLEVSGGSGTYTYLWSNGASTQDLSGLAAGIYTVSITDAGTGQVYEKTVTVNNVSTITLSETISNASNCGAADGSIDLSVGGGSGSYAFNWSNASTSEDISFLSAGTYSVTVQDLATGCEAAGIYLVEEDNALTATAVVSDAACHAADGSIDLSVAGGVGPYTYSWSNGATTEDLSGLIPGIYVINVSDLGSSCAVSGIFTVSEIGGPSLTFNVTDNVCAAGSAGSIDLVVAAGSGSYHYQWSNGDTLEDLNNLTSNTYLVNVTDLISGCRSVGQATVSESLPLDLAIDRDSVVCSGDSTGTVAVTPIGGTPAYNYSWSDGQSSPTAINLSVGTYTVTVTDAGSCFNSTDVTIAEPQALAVVLDSVPVNCNGGSDGSASATVSGGVSPYTYLWSDGQTNNTATGLVAGPYTVTVTDANGCTIAGAISVLQPTALVSASGGTNINCKYGSNGTAHVVISGGSPGYAYIWSNGQTTDTIAGLLAGTYHVTVTDTNGCQLIDSVTTTEPADSISYTSDTTEVSCNGGSDGTATVIVSGGTPVYTYLWSDSQTTAAATGLSAGSYAVTITDANGCVLSNPVTDSIVVTEPPAVSFNLDSVNVSCYAGNDGRVFVTPNGGVGGYSFLWSDGQTTDTAFSLSAGTYGVIVTDGNGCSTGTATGDSIVVNQPTALSLTMDSVPVSCNAGNDGSASATVSGGVSPYTYLWSDGQTNDTATGLIAGAYAVTVTDVNGCTVNGSTNVIQPVPLTIAKDSINVRCFGESNAMAAVSASGGNPGYSYLWSTGSTNDTIANLSAGAYRVTVTDSQGCIDSASFTIAAPAMLDASTVITHAACENSSDGSIDLTVAGGTMPYAYNWSTGATAEDVSALTTGIYTVHVLDTNGCAWNGAYTVNYTNDLSVAAFVIDPLCGISDGSIDLTVSDGSGNYSYAWSTLATTEDLDNIGAGSYGVTVTDNITGCTSDRILAVSSSGGPAVDAVLSDATTCIATDGAIDVTVTTGSGNNTYNWSTGSTTEDLSGLAPGNYQLTVTDTVSNCNAVHSFTIDSENGISIDATVSLANCGLNSGSIDLSVSGATGPLAYYWSNGSTTEDINDLPSGMYAVTVTDVLSGCTAESVLSVGEASPLTLSLATSDLSCSLSNDGSIDLSVVGGSGSIGYHWSNNAVSEDVTGLQEGVYSVTVFDSLSGCSTFGIDTVNAPPELDVVTIDRFNVTCNSGGNGYLVVHGQGGSPAYSYLWSTGGTSDTLFGLTSGDYIVTVTDASSCTHSDTIALTEPPVMNVTVGFDSVRCYGDSTGVVYASAIGGIAPYSYYWSTGDSTDTVGALIAGWYFVTVTDAKGCTMVDSTDVAQPTPLALTMDSTNVSINGATDGTATATSSGGTSTHTYLWSDGQTNATATNLGVGTYYVTVTDNNGCTITDSTVVNEPPPLGNNAVIIHVPCFADTSGSIASNPYGGTPGYTYAWSTGSTDSILTNVAAGTYYLTVTDANLDFAIDTINVNQPPSMILTADTTDLNCYGSYDGGIDLSASGGVAPYTYAWSNGSTTEDVGSLTAGVYTVTVTDSNGCVDSLSASILEPTELVLSGTITNATCGGSSDGAIDVTAAGGTPGYNYHWSHLATSEDASGLPAGLYTVQVTDSNGCLVSGAFSVGEDNGISVSYSVLDALCGSNDGTIDVFVSGGSGNYSYLWSTGATTKEITGLSEGMYSVTVTDLISGCTSTQIVPVSSVGGPDVTAILNEVTSCGGSDGSIVLSVSGGSGSFSYAWSGGQTSQNVSSLSAGTHHVTVTDDTTGCASIQTLLLGENNSLMVSAVSTVAGCGLPTGSIDVSVSGGSGAYAYVWSNGSTVEDQIGLASGTYTLTVQDAASSCIYDTVLTLSDSGGPTFTIASSDNNCSMSGTGTIDLTITGGAGPYAILWSNNSTAEDLDSLDPGTYVVTVTDTLTGCTGTGSAEVSDQPALHIAVFDRANVSCNGGSDGMLYLNVLGGNPGYTYSWSTGDTTAQLTGLAAGIYQVTASDTNGCAVADSFEITEPLQLTFTISDSSLTTCYGGNDGTASVTPSGGTPPYTYLWSDGQTDSALTNLGAGIYFVTVFDANGCSLSSDSLSDTIYILEPSPISIVADSMHVSCYGGSDGWASVVATGGTPGYTYSWNNGAVDSLADSLTAGTYQVVVTDANGCSFFNPDDSKVEIIQPDSILLSFIDTAVSCYGGNDGSATVSVSGGVGPYAYLWSNGQTDSSIVNLSAGNYTVTVTDANGCPAGGIPLGVVVIAEPAALALSLDSVDVSCNGGSDGMASVIVTGGMPPYAYLWSDGQTQDTAVGLIAGMYYVTVTDSNGCVLSDSTTGSATINEPLPMTYLLDSGMVDCYGDSTGYAAVTPSGGTPPYGYLWSDGQTDSSATGLTAGDYAVTVTDANGCSVSTVANGDSIIITQVGPFVVDMDSIDVSCNGFNDGSAIANVTGSTSPYTFVWSDGQTAQTATGLVAGIFHVTIADANGCTVNDSIEVNEPSEMTIDFDSTNVSCFGLSDGAIDITASGGNPPYTYFWMHGSLTEDLVNIPAGTYDVIVTGSLGCQAFATIRIDEPPALSVNGSLQNTTCSGAGDGSVNLNASGGSPPYTFSWSDGQTTEDLSGVEAGLYTVHVTDSQGCQVNQAFTIVNDHEMTVSAAIVHSMCDSADGSIDLTVSGGLGTYQFNWSNSAVTEDISNLSAGAYSVTITDGGTGCIQIEDHQISASSGPELTSIVQHTSFCGAVDGSVAVSATAGSGLYSYAWSHGATASTVSGLSSGTYNVTVTDDVTGCISLQSYVVQDSNTLTINHVAADAGCGSASGSIDLTIGGGSGNYAFNWSTGAISEDLSGLASGIYIVTVTDSVNGCTREAPIAIQEASGPVVNVVTTDIRCPGFTDGSADVTVMGAGPFGYQWSNGSTLEDLTMVEQGTYYVTVTDLATGCESVAEAVVSEPLALFVAITGRDEVTCNGNSDGELVAIAAGGTGLHTFNWSDGATGDTNTNLSAGAYAVTVSDQNFCAIAASVVIGEPTALTTSVLATDLRCYDDSSGLAIVQLSGGVAPYSYLWSDGQVDDTAAALQAGAYDVTMTDANGCIEIASNITVNQPPALIIDSISSANLSCFGLNDGNSIVSVSGGTPGYVYAWSDGQSSSMATGLSAGTYTVAVTDQNGCYVSDSVIIAEPAQIMLSATSDPVTCFGDADGRLAVSATGGVAPFAYWWPNGMNVSSAVNLSAGTYDITVVDQNGCTESIAVDVVEPPQINIETQVTHVSCHGEADATIAVIPTGGLPGYSFTWDNGYTAAQLQNLSGGAYQVTVTDASGCSQSILELVEEPDAIGIEFLHQDPTCQDVENGFVASEVFGGSAPYFYQWSTGSEERNLTGLAAGIYSLSVTDANGCTLSESIMLVDKEPVQVTIEAEFVEIDLGESIQLDAEHNLFHDSVLIVWTPSTGLSCTDCPDPVASPYASTTYTIEVINATDPLNRCSQTASVEVVVQDRALVFIPNAFTPNGDGDNDVFTIFGENITGVELLVFNRLGEKLYEGSGVSIGWDGTYKGQLQNPGVYVFTARISLLNGKQETRKGTITLLR